MHLSQSKAPQPQWDSFRLSVPGAPRDLEVHLVPFASVAQWAQQVLGDLEPAERARAEKRMDPQTRVLRLASASVLRTLLSRRLGISPGEVLLRRQGRRPRLDPVHGNLQFSVARGVELIAVATATRAVGIDIEGRQTRHQAKALMQVLHPVETFRLRLITNLLHRKAVTKAWTRKEAVLKAWGVGLDRDPSLDLTGICGRRTVSAEGFDPVTVMTVLSGDFSLAVAWAAQPPDH